MSQQSLAVVGKWFATFADDRDAFERTLHPEIEWFPFEENHTPSRGIDAAMRIRDQWAGTWEDFRAEVEDLVDRGESVVASIHAVGRGKASGVEVDTRLHLHFEVRDGKIAYVYEHEDREAAFEAAGIAPPPRRRSFVDAFADAHRAGQAAFNEGDMERAFAGIAPDVEWHILAELPDSSVLHGRDAVARYFKSVREGIDWTVEAQEFIDAGNGRVVVRQLGQAKGRTTGVADTAEFFQVLEIGESGMVARVREYTERDAALEAVGLAP